MAAVKKLAKKIDIPIYEQILYVANGEEALNKLLKRDYDIEVDLDLEGSVGYVALVECDSITFSVLLVMDESLQTLCHEAVHAAWRSLDRAGVKLTASNHEAMAYLTDFIFAEGKKALRL